MISLPPLCGAVGGLVTASLAVLAPAALAAQVPGPPAPRAGASPAQALAPRWNFRVSANGSWYENAYFTTAGESTAWSTGSTATLSFTEGFRRGSFAASAFGGVLYYPEVEGFTQPTYGGTLGLSWAPSPRTSLSLDQSYRHSNTREYVPDPTQDVPLPTSAIHASNTSVSLSRGLSRRWQLGVGAGFAVRRYDDPALTDGEDLNASLQISHPLGERSSAFFSYGFGQSWFADEDTRFHQALLGARRELGKGLDFDVAAGVAYLESSGSLYPAGHAGIEASGRRTSLSLRYSRDFGQAFGYGRQTIADVISARLGWEAHRRLSLDAGYDVGYRRDPADAGYEIRSLVASAGLAWTIARELGFAAHYYWERNDTEGFDVVDGSRVTASLSYGVSWR